VNDSVYTPRSAAFLARIESEVAGRSAAATADRVEALVGAQGDHRTRRCLNMNPAESGMSPRALQLLASDMATRLGEGLPGDKIYPHGIQTAAVDELEAIVIALARRQFGAAFVEWRPVSTSMANAAVFFSLLDRGDRILVQDEALGGNYSYHPRGPAGLAALQIAEIGGQSDTFEIDLDALARRARTLSPRMIVIGGSNVLFPYPVAEIRRIADEVGALLLYDAAHLGLLISAGAFQRPLAEGAHLVTISTHKIMGGPVGGMVLTNHAELAAPIVRLTFPGLMQTRDQNKFAALALSLAETSGDGEILARAMVANAQALAAALDDKGFRVIGRDRGFTRTHQLFLDLGDEAQRFEQHCHAANLMVSDCALPVDAGTARRSGARLATHELTRLGLVEADMQRVADLIYRASRSREPARIALEVETLLESRRRHAPEARA
jgi:glycine hydroxymethyltransferase